MITLKASEIMTVGRAERFTFPYVVCAVVSCSPVDPVVMGHEGSGRFSIHYSPYTTHFLFVTLTINMFPPNTRARGGIGVHFVPGLIG